MPVSHFYFLVQKTKLQLQIEAILICYMLIYLEAVSFADIDELEGTGAYGPLLLAPAEGLGGPSGPLICGGIYFNN